MFASIKSRLTQFIRLYHVDNLREKGLFWSGLLLAFTICIGLFFLGVYWSQEPEQLDPRQLVTEYNAEATTKPIPGLTITNTLVGIADTLLSKPGGYLSNDKFPPTSLFGIVDLLDNIPNWEFGLLIMVRDTSRVLRNDFSRSQSQSLENKHLSEAEPRFNFSNDSWLFPPTETQYRQGIENLILYRDELASQASSNTQFFTRADNLNELLAVIEKRLGDYSQRLNASVEEIRINTDLAGDPDAEQSTSSPRYILTKTPWLDIDNVYYESRGYVWGLIAILRAVEIDFNNVLKKKNAIASLKQVIRLLEQTQIAPSSPMVLNGDPMGWLANYSKTAVSYISPANAAIIDLRSLLTKG